MLCDGGAGAVGGMTARTFTNARIVTPGTVIENGALATEGPVIVDVGDACSPRGATIDFEGDLLLPGLVELHTDNIERHMAPRPGVSWPTRNAIVAHDAEMAAAGFTTVLDAVRIGDIWKDEAFDERVPSTLDAIGRLNDAGLTRAEHFVHLRCEICHGSTAETFERVSGVPGVRLVSLMDHTPGQRQFVDADKLKFYYVQKYGMTDAQFERFVAERLAAHELYSASNRRRIVERARNAGHALASHDDATLAHVDEAIADGVSIAEFPTTVTAAKASHEAGLAVMIGGPNLVLGGSQSGNVAAIELARAGAADIISSDYVPASALTGAFALAAAIGLDLPEAIRTVSLNPARAIGCADRGELAPRKRADLLRVRLVDGSPIIREVWRSGERVL